MSFGTWIAWQKAHHIDASRFICELFANQKRLNEIYNAADIALFGNTTISVTAAAGTGLVLCLADVGAMDIVVTKPDQAVYFQFRNSDRPCL